MGGWEGPVELPSQSDSEQKNAYVQEVEVTRVCGEYCVVWPKLQ